MLIHNHNASELLDAAVEKGCDAKNTAAWILTDCAGILRKNGKIISDIKRASHGMIRERLFLISPKNFRPESSGSIMSGIKQGSRYRQDMAPPQYSQRPCLSGIVVAPHKGHCTALAVSWDTLSCLAALRPVSRASFISLPREIFSL